LYQRWHVAADRDRIRKVFDLLIGGCDLLLVTLAGVAAVRGVHLRTDTRDDFVDDVRLKMSSMAPITARSMMSIGNWRWLRQTASPRL
jgi:hypothetical protein